MSKAEAPSPEEPLPFKCEYEIGVHPAGQPEEWEHYHPKAGTLNEAESLAKGSARHDGMEEPVVYMTSGPFKPDNPSRVGREMIEEVFGDE